jgi:catechol 2,3-dioxygenase-like lactoylglutathione lyase family enzyme
MRLAEFINDRVLAPFDVRITRASGWRQTQKLQALAASGVARERIMKLGSLLAPQHVVGQSKVRLGSKCDGGYICLDDFCGIATAFSIGVGETEFDEIFGRIRERGLRYWADPAQTKEQQINHHDGGRGVYFEDPNGHLMEIITRPYGSGGWNP